MNLGGDEWANEWPKDSAWDFVALGKGHDVDFWTEFLLALHEVDPGMLVNIEHEDVELGRIEGLEVAAKGPQGRRCGPHRLARHRLTRAAERTQTGSYRALVLRFTGNLDRD